MIKIAEKLNSSVPKTLEALMNNDKQYLLEMVLKQAEAGADFLDINTALTRDAEISSMLMLIELIHNNSQCGIMLDSPNKDAIISCIDKVKNRKVIVNSITLEEKYDELIEICKNYGASIVCLPIETREIPKNPVQRLTNAQRIIEKLSKFGIDENDIFIDVLVEAIATDDTAGVTALETIRLIKNNFPKVKTICGLSNISFGLPKRETINSAFLTMALECGLDSAIFDVTNSKNKDAITLSRAILGKDEFCVNYIRNFRENNT